MKISKLLFCFFIVALALYACKKMDNYEFSSKTSSTENGHLKQVKTFDTDVLIDWITLDLKLLRDNPARLNNFVMLHHWSYSSVALYEALVAGMPAYRSLQNQLNEMPVLPTVEKGKAYHWPTTANAVLAAMMRNFYKDSITASGVIAINELEQKWYEAAHQETDHLTFSRSRDYGIKIAELIYKWGLTDGYEKQHPTYVLPIGPGQWEKTGPSFLSPQRPYWGSNRPMMAGSIAASQIPAPPVFSPDPGSEFYNAAGEVFEFSKNLSQDAKDKILFWRDVPGGGHAHWLSIFLQILKKEGVNVGLDKAIMIYAKMGITQNDARISCWKAKYQYNLLRPVTYISRYMQAGWTSFITTPNHPEYPSAHSSFSEPAAFVLTHELGANYTFTDDSYNFLPLPARTYKSFQHAADEAGESRILGGLHYAFSITAGKSLGEAIARYMYKNIQFEK